VGLALTVTATAIERRARSASARCGKAANGLHAGAVPRILVHAVLQDKDKKEKKTKDKVPPPNGVASRVRPSYVGVVAHATQSKKSHKKHKKHKKSKD
jgi:hypothetical protein